MFEDRAFSSALHSDLPTPGFRVVDARLAELEAQDPPPALLSAITELLTAL